MLPGQKGRIRLAKKSTTYYSALYWLAPSMEGPMRASSSREPASATCGAETSGDLYRRRRGAPPNFLSASSTWRGEPGRSRGELC